MFISESLVHVVIERVPIVTERYLVNFTVPEILTLLPLFRHLQYVVAAEILNAIRLVQTGLLSEFRLLVLKDCLLLLVIGDSGHVGIFHLGVLHFV